MRPPPCFFQTTSQTPALPGFAVSGGAKFAGFETFRVSSGFGELLSLTSTSDPSVLRGMKGAEAVSVQRSAPFERVQIASSVERPCSIRAVSHPHSRRSFERVQITAVLPRERAGAVAEHDPYLNAFKWKPGQSQSGQSPDTRAAASPFERVQMPRERTQFPMPSRPRHPNGPPRRPLAQTSRPRSTSNPKEANPVSSTQ